MKEIYLCFTLASGGRVEVTLRKPITGEGVQRLIDLLIIAKDAAPESAEQATTVTTLIPPPSAETKR